MATNKKHPTAVNIVSPGDGVFAEQLNYGDSTGSVISVSDVIMRHIEDYNAKFIPNRIYSNSLTNPSGLTFRLNDGAYATINGRWLKVAGDTDITLSGDNTHYIYLQISDDGGSETTRIPESDTFALTSATSYTESQENLLLAKVVVSGGAVGTFTNYYDGYGSAHLRASAIKPVSSTITMFGGALESATPVAQYSSNYLTFFDDKYLSFGTDKDSKITFVSASNKLLWDLPSGDLEISGGTITGVPNPTANDEVANKAYVDSNITAQDVDIATDSGSIAIDLDSEILTLTGTGALNTSATANTVTFAVPVDDTAVDGSTTTPISSNWAFDHAGDTGIHHTKYALTEDFTASEITQLQNINSSTISTTQWGYLGGLNQALTTSSSVTFNSISASSTQLVSANPDSTGSHGNTGDVGDVNLAYDDDSQAYTYTSTYTVVSGQANTITVLKDSISVYHSISVQLLDGATVRTANVDVILEANNGSGWTSVDTHTYSGLTGNSNDTLVWTITADGKYFSDDFGDSLQLRAGVRFTPSGNVTSGFGVLSSFDITNGSNWARFPRIVSANDGATLNSFV